MNSVCTISVMCNGAVNTSILLLVSLYCCCHYSSINRYAAALYRRNTLHLISCVIKYTSRKNLQLKEELLQIFQLQFQLLLISVTIMSLVGIFRMTPSSFSKKSSFSFCCLPACGAYVDMMFHTLFSITTCTFIILSECLSTFTTFSPSTAFNTTPTLLPFVFSPVYINLYPLPNCLEQFHFHFVS